MKTVSIVIPNYNGKHLLVKNIPKLLELVKENKKNIVEIIIVDDCSTDGSIDFLTKLKNENSLIRVYRNDKNYGFSTTINKGVQNAQGEIVLLLNTDAYPEKDFLEPALSHFVDEKVFAVGGMDKSIEKGKVILRGRGIGQWRRGFLIHSRGNVDKKNTLWVSGGSSFFNKTIWKKLDGLNEIYNPFYYEDIDISYRALKSGYKIFFENKSVFIHEHESGAIFTNYSKEQIKQIAFRNQFIFVWINATDLLLQFSHVLWLPYHFIKAVIRGDLAFFIGFFRALVLVPRVASSSMRAHKLFVVIDKKVVQEFSR